eukprot:gene13996-biopygen11287
MRGMPPRRIRGGGAHARALGRGGWRQAPAVGIRRKPCAACQHLAEAATVPEDTVADLRIRRLDESGQPYDACYPYQAEARRV